MNKYLICIIIAVTITFAIAGVFCTFSAMPKLEIEIKNLKTEKIDMQNTINQYKSAMKFENLFMLVASPNNVMDFETLEVYIQERKDFYKNAK